MKSKKGYSLIINALIVVAILSIAAFVILAWWTPAYGGGIKQLGGFLNNCDQDDVKDNSDACPCDTTIKGSNSNRGCPEGYIITRVNSGREDRTCIEKGCPKTT